jgi:hypothetical protein
MHSGFEIHDHHHINLSLRSGPMNASKVCLYSEVIHSIPDDQRSAPVNICADRTGSLHAHSSSINAESLPLRSSCVRLKRGYRASSAEHRAALFRNRMATAASIGSQSVKIIVEQARSKTAQSLALPCPSNVVRVCLAGTKYNVGKLKIQLHDPYTAIQSCVSQVPKNKGS